MGIDLHRQLRQTQELSKELERALTLPPQIQSLISDIDGMVGQLQRVRFNLQSTLTDFKLNGAAVDRTLYGDKNQK